MIKTIDLKEWKVFSERSNSVNYIKEDGKWMLKVFRGKLAGGVEQLERESLVTNTVLKMGIPTPRVGEIVKTEDGYYGLIYECIKNKKSMGRAFMQNPDDYEKYSEIVARLIKKVHTTQCDKSVFPSYIEKFEGILNSTDIYSKEEKERFLKFVKETEPATTCLHGDFQYGNFVASDEGEEFVIDLGDMAYGNPLFDLGELYLWIKILPLKIRNLIFDAKEEQVEGLWKHFIKQYFDVSTDEEIKEKEKLIEPFGCIAAVYFVKLAPVDWHFEEILRNYLKEHPIL